MDWDTHFQDKEGMCVRNLIVELYQKVSCLRFALSWAEFLVAGVSSAHVVAGATDGGTSGEPRGGLGQGEPSRSSLYLSLTPGGFLL